MPHRKANATTPTPGDQVVERIQCNRCGSYTRHKRQYTYRHVVSAVLDNPSGSDSETEVWDVWECLGCEAVTVRLTYPDIGPIGMYFPMRTADQYGKRSFAAVPPGLDILYSQVVNALDRDDFLLCAAGLRALIEGICEDKGITEGPNQAGKIVTTLEGKINGLVAVLPDSAVPNLHALRFLGNKALHELRVPSERDLELALNVSEDMLYYVYDFNAKARLLYDKVTPIHLRQTRDRAEAVSIAKSWLRSDPLYLDIESTGLDVNAEVLALALLGTNGDILYHAIIKPMKRINPGIEMITGITNQMTKETLPFSSVLPLLRQAIDRHDVISYNASFDRMILEQTLVGIAADKSFLETLRFHDLALLYAQYRGEWSESAGRYRHQPIRKALEQCGLAVPDTSQVLPSAISYRLLLMHVAETT